MFHQLTVVQVSAANDCHDAFSWHRACQCLNPYDGQGRLCHNLSICKLCPNQLRQQEQSDIDKKKAMCAETCGNREVFRQCLWGINECINSSPWSHLLADITTRASMQNPSTTKQLPLPRTLKLSKSSWVVKVVEMLQMLWSSWGSFF